MPDVEHVALQKPDSESEDDEGDDNDDTEAVKPEVSSSSSDDEEENQPQKAPVVLDAEEQIEEEAELLHCDHPVGSDFQVCGCTCNRSSKKYKKELLHRQSHRR